MDPVQQFHDSEIQQKFEAIQEILRDEAHEGIGEAIHDLRNMVTRMELDWWTLRHTAAKAQSILKAGLKLE